MCKMKPEYHHPPTHAEWNIQRNAHVTCTDLPAYLCAIWISSRCSRVAKYFQMTAVWEQCRRRLPRRTGVSVRPCYPRARGGTHPPRAAMHRTPGSRGQAAFFCYCLGLKGPISSHFAPLARLARRDQSSGSGGGKKTYINHWHNHTRVCSRTRARTVGTYGKTGYVMS